MAGVVNIPQDEPTITITSTDPDVVTVVQDDTVTMIETTPVVVLDGDDVSLQ